MSGHEVLRESDPVWSDSVFDSEWIKLARQRAQCEKHSEPEASSVKTIEPLSREQINFLSNPAVISSDRALEGSLRQAEPTRATDQMKPRTPKPVNPSQGESESSSYRHVTAFSADFLHKVEHSLAVFIGPLAKIVVKKSASQTTDRRKFLESVAASINLQTDRRAFLAQHARMMVEGSEQVASSSRGDSRAITRTADSPNGITAAEVDRAAHLLAEYVGPLAGVLTKKAAQRTEQIREFYLLLAEHVETKSERDRFLHQAGIR
jgi:serine/threonine-protein kinase